MCRILTLFLLSAIASSAAAWAADDQYSSDTSLSSTTSTSEVTRGFLRNEIVGVTPQVGVFAFTDQLGDATARAAYGLTAEANVASAIGREYLGNFFVGPATGVLYSHLGDPTSNLLGSNSSTSLGTSSANLLLIPADLKVGYNLSDSFRIAAHGGGNLIYRSVASSLFLGSSSFQTGSNWRIFPNVGGDVDLGIGRNVAITLRPDVTLSPGNTLFTGTVGLNILLS